MRLHGRVRCAFSPKLSRAQQFCFQTAQIARCIKRGLIPLRLPDHLRHAVHNLVLGLVAVGVF